MNNSPRERSLGAQMAIALQLMKKANNHAIVEAGINITMEQLAVLEILNSQGDMNMTELGKRLLYIIVTVCIAGAVWKAFSSKAPFICSSL